MYDLNVCEISETQFLLALELFRMAISSIEYH
jgi:hypothetical protein